MFASAEPLLRAETMASPMRGGISFAPFPLLSREVVSRSGAEFEVLLLRFGLDAGASLGFSQPTTHVKVRIEGSLLPRARTFSLVSDAGERGSFSICIKVRPAGRLTPWLAALRPGTDSARFARTLTKRLNFPIDEDGDGARGRRLSIVVFGIGVTEVLLTVRRALRAGQIVSLLFAARRSADLVFVRELCEAASSFGGNAIAGAGAECAPDIAPLRLRFLLSREEPPPAFLAELDDLCGGSAADCGVIAARGRIDAATVGEAFESAEWADAAALAVGTKRQARDAYALLAAAGVTKRLLGKPIVWGCW